ncbi:uncharacterized protein BJX67DRAFT_383224 [Aspergillus lucknowensis]|uniref:Uncharacterized protein n=1 Tax=Aspergillus lucknowensis TaxID=176173 RepID=A0ABR4LKF0_9EURO
MISASFFTLVSLLTLTGTSLAAPATSPANPLQKRFEFTCSTPSYNYVPIGEAQQCVDLLLARGTEDCVIPHETQVFCHLDHGSVTGTNIGPGGGSSLCRDVAWAAQTIINGCGTVEGYVGGANAAGGNGALIVHIDGRQAA